ncbi:MAG: glutamate-5-semialdehyde dehydrogenase [Thermoanaerobaculia bacterium]
MTAEDGVRSRVAAAKVAARVLAGVPTEAKNRALRAAAGRIESDATAILEANAADVSEARALVDAGALAWSLVDRLVLDAAKVRAMADGVRAVAALPDPSGRLLEKTLLDDGLVLEKVTCPLGVLAVVFESRPDAVPQIGALALKSGNAALLKGGRESARSASAILSAIRSGLSEVPEIPQDTLQLLSTREEVEALLSLDSEIDLVIPRGGADLVRHVRSHTRIPVLGHAEGVCHVYIDRAADPQKAIAIAVDSKTTYPAACNSAETLLIHHEAAARSLKPLVEALRAKGVEIRACERTRALAPELGLAEASEDDFGREFGALILAVRTVESLDEAIAHVNRFGSRHTDAIVTEDHSAADRFLAEVDAAGVYVNASTRFADGFRYGFGAEVGVSTSKLHARGPVGLEGLVTYKYRLRGDGHVVATYTGNNARPFRHVRLDPGR